MVIRGLKVTIFGLQKHCYTYDATLKLWFIEIRIPSAQ